MYLVPETSNQIDIIGLMNSVSEATPKSNAQLMAGLVMHVNFILNFFKLKIFRSIC